MIRTDLSANSKMTGQLDELTRQGDEIRDRLRRAAERVDQLDAELPLSKRADLVPALRSLRAIADELAQHATHYRLHLVL